MNNENNDDHHIRINYIQKNLVTIQFIILLLCLIKKNSTMLSFLSKY